MGGYASGKRSWAISDRSGLKFPYTEMVREWNGMLVHTSEYEPKQPQLDPKPVGSDPQALWNPRPQPASTASLILLTVDPFTTVKYGGTTYVNVYSLDHQRSTGDTVRLRGAAQVTSAGSGGADATNLQAFRSIPTFDNVSDIDSATGFTITVGQKKSDGSVTTAPGTLTSPENYFFFTSTDTATSGGILGGGSNSSAGPVTLKVVNG
jgi:hypothetical protein